MKILVVDDDEVIRQMLCYALEQSFDDEVLVACNGREALEIVQKGEVQLVISDWEMPEMSGLDLCRAIRSGESPRYVYVILLTSRNSKQDTVAGMTAGADDFICKPFDPSELTVRLRAGQRILSLETRDLAIFAMAKLAESRDPETGKHLERVRNYSRILAEQLASNPIPGQEVLTREQCRLIYLTSPLHDIGKVAIPDCVLLKPGRLSNREFEIMKTHAATGAETLNAALQEHPTAEFLRMARDIAAYHHERFDGSGYPEGLSGADIPLPARLVALADVYDALTSKRIYKDAFTHDIAHSVISDESGKHFDPNIVEAFLQTEDRFHAVRNQYNEATPAAA